MKASGNNYVSRNHAYIKYNAETNTFFLYAENGGLMERGNKIKLYKANNVIHRLDIAGVGHELNDGDIIELGGSQIIIYTPACRLIEYDWKSVSDIQSKIKP